MMVYGSVSEYIIVRSDAGEFEECGGGGLKSRSMYGGVMRYYIRNMILCIYTVEDGKRKWDNF